MNINSENSFQIYNDIKKDLLFYICEERFCCSTLLDLVKLSPGNWFDVEELTGRKSIKSVCGDIQIIHNIIKSIDEFEYNDLTGQIRIKNSKAIIDDIINEKTILFYSNIEFDENKLTEIITENKLNVKIMRFLRYDQLHRRDLKPLVPILKNKVTTKNQNIVILKMFTRIEAIKILNIVSQHYPNIGSCFAITNYFPNGSLSINLPDNPDSVEREPILIEHSMTDSTLIVSNYVHRANEYPVILDHLIEKNLKPNIYRSFVEYRLNEYDMKQIPKTCLSIPFSNIGVFSLITFDTIDKAEMACELIQKLIYYLDVKTLAQARNMKNPEQYSNNFTPTFTNEERYYYNDSNKPIATLNEGEFERRSEKNFYNSNLNNAIEIDDQSSHLSNTRNLDHNHIDNNRNKKFNGKPKFNRNDRGFQSYRPTSQYSSGNKQYLKYNEY